MCRWLAYCGEPIFLDSLIFEPEHSLINQSRRALQSHTPTNGDGFGIGWYDRRAEPGVFRDTLPAWNDENLRSLCRQIRAPLFFGHVRASTGTATARTNCHPFRHGRWLFMHNGVIGGFQRLRRDLLLRVAPEYFPYIAGTTDSETFFYLLLSNGLEDDPMGALGRTVAQLRAVTQAAGVTEPFKMTAALSDGETVYALRYASDGEAPSLFYACGAQPQTDDGRPVGGAAASVLILSEPLDHAEAQWVAIPESHILIAGGGGLAVEPFALA